MASLSPLPTDPTNAQATTTLAHEQQQQPNTRERSQAASIVSLRIPSAAISQLNSAATSMLTVCQDEKNGEAIGEVGVVMEEGREDDGACTTAAAQAEPQVHLTFLLVTGSRKMMSFHPETTVGRVKELVWNAWPSDWTDEKPSAPSFLRILHLGKILQDEDTLAGLSLPFPNSPISIPAGTRTSQGGPPHSTIVHLSVRPYTPVVEDEALIKKNLRAARRALSRTGGTPAPPNSTGETNTSITGPDDARAGGCCGCIIC